MKTEIVTVPLGNVRATFAKHGVSEAETTTVLTFLVKIWLANEHDVHDELTRDTIHLLNLGDELTEQMLLMEVMPMLIPIASAVHDSQEDRVLAGLDVKPYVLILEFLP